MSLRILASAFAALLVLVASPRVACAQNPSLSGSWVLNEDESDDPREQFQGARGQAGAQGQPPGGRGSGGRRPGGRGAGGGQAGQEMQRLIEASQALKILQDDSSVTMVGAEGTRLVFYTDGRAIEYPVQDVGVVVTTARWQGERLVVEREVEGGMKATATYEIASNGRQLYVTVRLEGGLMPDPMQFRRVYDADG